MMVSLDVGNAPRVQYHLRKAGAVTLATNSFLGSNRFLEGYANRFPKIYRRRGHKPKSYPLSRSVSSYGSSS